jgi:hypothetical protein
VIKAQTMSMLNLDGQLVASALLNQQAGEVARELLDSRNTTKVQQAWEQQLFALQQQYAQLLSRYNNLVNEYNDALAENKRIDAARAAKIADKDRRNVQLARENEEFRRIGLQAYEQLDEAEKEIRRLKIKAGELPPDESNPNSAA